MEGRNGQVTGEKMKKVLKVILWILGIIVGLAIVLFVVAAVAMMIQNGNDGAKETLKNSKLTQYTYNSGGDMRGSSNGVTVMEKDSSHAVISYISKGWYADYPHVSEEVVDRQILDELEEVFRKYDMQRWDGKSFTKMFVADGASHSYSFVFGKELYYRFSSQIYPEPYRSKLDEFNGILDRYRGTGETLPSLVFEEKEGAELANYRDEIKKNGKVTMEINSYACGHLEYSYTNGTNEQINIPNDCYELYKDGQEEPVKTINSRYEGYTAFVFPGGNQQDTLEGEVWLEAGTYRLVNAKSREYSCEFVIK